MEKTWTTIKTDYSCFLRPGCFNLLPQDLPDSPFGSQVSTKIEINFVCPISDTMAIGNAVNFDACGEDLQRVV